ncbi:MAG: sterol desaturase family protein [Alphaproteobacteria bacterium]|nr:sterol desaturase family protein [Alphaproteobacteria bacterium]
MSPSPANGIRARRLPAGALSAALGLLGLLSVLCFHFPEWLTTPEVRAAIDLPLLRKLLLGGLIAAIASGVAALFLRAERRAGLIGLTAAAVAFALGGHTVPETQAVPLRTFYIGLDYFILSLFFTALAFVTLERLFPKRADQPVMRAEAGLDLRYFALNHLGVSLILLTVNGIAAMAGDVRLTGGLLPDPAAMPLWLQFLMIVLVADLTQYWQHRIFHRVPFLWRFHAVHHSVRQMDWLAGSRLHFLEVLFQRALVVAPIHLLGFAREAIDIYVIFAGIITVFIHANIGVDFGWLRYVIATPSFHHWHHAASPEAHDRNFAVHLPVLDLLFGTFHLPGRRWPDAYGLEGKRPAQGLIAQHLQPFRRAPDGAP